jgi:hypothetical protein
MYPETDISKPREHEEIVVFHYLSEGLDFLEML